MKKKNNIAISLLLALSLVLGSMGVASAGEINGESAKNEEMNLISTQEQNEKVDKVNLKKVSYYSYSKIKLSWDKVEGADGYHIYRKSSKKGKYTRVALLTDGLKTSYIDSKRTTGKRYYYRMRAFKLVDGKKVYGSSSAVKSAFARPNKGKVLGYKALLTGEYVGERLVFTVKKIAGADGYRVKFREIGKSKWQYYNMVGWNNNIKRYPYVKGNKVALFIDQDKDMEIKVRAFRNVKSHGKTKRVYGYWSNTYKIEPHCSKESIEKAMTEYIKKNYPKFDFYTTDVNNEPLTPKNASFDFLWSNKVYSQYSSVSQIMEGLRNSIDYYLQHIIPNSIENPNDPSYYGGGTPYVEWDQEEGGYHVYILF